MAPSQCPHTIIIQDQERYIARGKHIANMHVNVQSHRTGKQKCDIGV